MRLIHILVDRADRSMAGERFTPVGGIREIKSIDRVIVRSRGPHRVNAAIRRRHKIWINRMIFRSALVNSADLLECLAHVVRSCEVHPGGLRAADIAVRIIHVKIAVHEIRR